MERSLFDSPGTGPLSSAASWPAELLMGSAGLALCVIAVMFVGYQMLSGRFALRTGGRVIAGVFILLGAPVISAGFVGLVADAPRERVTSIVADETTQPREPLPPAEYDPYAGASLRSD